MVTYTLLCLMAPRIGGSPKSRRESGRIAFPAEVAQLVEQWSEEPCVASSILALGTECFCWCFFIAFLSMGSRGFGVFREKWCNGAREPFADSPGRASAG